MTKDSADIEYDPDFPFVTVSDITGYISAKFRTREQAVRWTNHDDYVRVVDTTPKPKIPEDAEFIYYLDSGGEYQFGHRDTYKGKEIWWAGAGDYFTTSEILEYIGDGEVTVLVRKEEM